MSFFQKKNCLLTVITDTVVVQIIFFVNLLACEWKAFILSSIINFYEASGKWVIAIGFCMIIYTLNLKPEFTACVVNFLLLTDDPCKDLT